jgi:hypothetical protein
VSACAGATLGVTPGARGRLAQGQALHREYVSSGMLEVYETLGANLTPWVSENTERIGHSRAFSGRFAGLIRRLGMTRRRHPHHRDLEGVLASFGGYSSDWRRQFVDPTAFLQSPQVCVSGGRTLKTIGNECVRRCLGVPGVFERKLAWGLRYSWWLSQTRNCTASAAAPPDPQTGGAPLSGTPRAPLLRFACAIVPLRSC